MTVVDFGGQYAQLIVRRIRELGVYSELVPWDKAEAHIGTKRPDAIVLSGGPRSVREPNAPRIDVAALEGIPTLGICYGMQLMAAELGGRVEPAADREYGLQELTVVTPGSLSSDLASRTVWMSHGDQVISAPDGFSVSASTASCPIAAFEDLARGFLAVQYHPEVTHTAGGQALLRRFLFEVAHLNGDWTSANFVDEQIEQIRARVGPDQRVLCAVSGGVDSSVMAALLIRAIGDRAQCVFVDTGLLRKGEAEQVEITFGGHFAGNIRVYKEHDRFFGALRGETDPERKRKIVGEQFVRVFEDHASELQGCSFLAQGTLYPDVIESGSSTAAKIKTHHNVGGLPDWLQLELIEPLRWLFKDEVRAVGRQLGLPDEMVDREPFPGPGLAVRITGEVTPERVRIVQEADAIFREILRGWDGRKQIWQSYAALLDVRSVGVMGDERTYQQPVVLRAVASEDAMTAHAVAIPFEILELSARRIVNEVAGVNRVFYDLTSKPPATIELE